MYVKYLASFLLLAATLGLSTGCQQEPDNTAEMILGYWEIDEAFRDGKPTESLDQLFFEFRPDGSMRTNLSGSADPATYSLSKQTIQQRESRIDTDYQVEEVSDSTLILTTVIRDYNFRFVLKKGAPEE